MNVQKVVYHKDHQMRKSKNNEMLVLAGKKVQLLIQEICTFTK
jgi:hypothetical protein